jgi:hypothetical protein
MLALETVSEFDTKVRIDDLQSNCRQPGWLKRSFQKPQDRGRRGRPKATDLAFEGIGRPKMSGARDHESPLEDASLVERILKGLRLSCRIDLVVGPCISRNRARLRSTVA